MAKVVNPMSVHKQALNQTPEGAEQNQCDYAYEDQPAHTPPPGCAGVVRHQLMIHLLQRLGGGCRLTVSAAMPGRKALARTGV